MFCAISGKPPRVAAISPSSKCVFEKGLLEQYVRDNGKDPISNEPLTLEQIITVAQSPQQTSLTNSLNSSTLNSNYSIPNLLSTLQNEWDALMLENFKLRKQLDQMSKELSTAFFERDAAKLVAARLLEEKEIKLNEIENVVSLYAKQGDVTNDQSDIFEKMIHESQNFTKLTKSSLPKESVLPSEDHFEVAIEDTKWQPMKTFEKISYIKNEKSFAMFNNITNELVVFQNSLQSKKKYKFDKDQIIQCLLLTNESNIVVLSFNASDLIVYDLEKNETIAALDFPLSDILLLDNHEMVMSNHILVVTQDGSVSYISLNSEDIGKSVQITKGNGINKYSSASLHKDGLLLALVEDTKISMINLSKPSDHPITFECGKEISNQGPVSKVAFPRNGYWMVVESGNEIFTFDLRKEDHSTMACATLTFESGITLQWDFDLSGKILTVLQQNESNVILTIYKYQKSTKSWDQKFNQEEPLESMHSNLRLLNRDQDSNNLAIYQTMATKTITWSSPL